MNSIYNTKIPVDNPYTYIRLFSNEGTSYFSKQEGPFLSKDMINKVDPQLRILCNVLLEKKCRIVSFFGIEQKNKEELNYLWNNIKREEKIIRNTGLKLKHIDGSSIEYKDSSYRTYWPSNEAFLKDYVDNCNKSWFVFDVPLQKSGSIISRKDLLECKVNHKTMKDFERFTIFSESALMAYNWRRLSQSIIDLISIEEFSQ